MSEPIELGKEYTTRDGRAVRIYALDVGVEREVHGAVATPAGRWHPRSWTCFGKYCEGVGRSNCDLIPTPRKHTLDVWVNVNNIEGRIRLGGSYSSRASADECSNPNRIAIKHLTFEVTEGEGLGEGVK